MDLFLYNPTYHLWICTAPRCQYTVTPFTLLTHLRTRHGSYLTAVTLPLREAALAAMLQRPWADPAREPGRQPPAGGLPLPGLPVYQGHGCPHCLYVARTLDAMEKHRRAKHREKDRVWEQGWLLAARARARHFFKVTCMAAPAAQGGKRRPVLTPAELVRAREVSQVPVLDPHPTKVSPWLELTRWPKYLRGQNLTMVQINTFFRQPSVWNRLIQIRLQPKTYHRYSQVWQRLVCFAYCSTRPDQLAALDRMEEYGRGLVALTAQALKPFTLAVAGQDAPPLILPAPDPLPRWTVPWKRKTGLAVLVGTLS
ncbi:hypothetical protein BDW74DRAFT_187881 [Aspergillus multicolor]|uniref:uncharacterized protein n=1 Tax=Aspergillus multicolor TaxID=41759 RepID=UPI003CCCBFE5